MNDLSQYEDSSFFSTSRSAPEWKSEAQFAMESSCFCVICGSPFDLEGEVYNLDAGAERYRELSAIEYLPTELLDHVITYISAYDILSLHCASKTLAKKLPLDNNSWRENILSGNGLPYLWDLDTELLNRRHQEHSAKSTGADAAWDWKAVGQLLATKHFPLKSSDPQIADLPNGLWNRRRIWSIVEQAYRHDFSRTPTRDPDRSILESRKRREPVYDWQLEEIMDDLGHYS
ncbi:hypothetical protein E8E13_004443 [Curvularia kusanoi]|uniref:F-box domain-containing protein n=1 Tax=Curvularia kusanoi TaxID=90978 RepID=A0A9P4WBV6_CURKU|nr:hypothetical protein E8E13_004443 [Curvularia kusanoi]